MSVTFGLSPIARQIVALEHCLVGLRHGQTAHNRSDRLTTVTDVPLTEIGERQAARVAEALRGVRFDRAATSPMRRAARTAQLATGLCDLGSGMTEDPRLVEPDAGPFEGLTFTELREGPHADAYRRYCDPVCPVAPPGAEPCEVTVQRAENVLRWARSAGGRTLIVSHGAFLRILACVATGMNPHNYRSLKLGNCGLMIIQFHPQPPNQLIAMNVQP